MSLISRRQFSAAETSSIRLTSDRGKKFDLISAFLRSVYEAWKGYELGLVELYTSVPKGHN